MRRFLASCVLGALALGCAGSEREVVVTREQFGGDWPLAVNSARVLCAEDGSALLKLGPQRYALDPASRQRGYPDASGLAVERPVDPSRPEIGNWPADLAPLRRVCSADVAAR